MTENIVVPPVTVVNWQKPIDALAITETDRTVSFDVSSAPRSPDTLLRFGGEFGGALEVNKLRARLFIAMSAARDLTDKLPAYASETPTTLAAKFAEQYKDGIGGSAEGWKSAINCIMAGKATFDKAEVNFRTVDVSGADVPNSLTNWNTYAFRRRTNTASGQELLAQCKSVAKIAIEPDPKYKSGTPVVCADECDAFATLTWGFAMKDVSRPKRPSQAQVNAAGALIRDALATAGVSLAEVRAALGIA